MAEDKALNRIRRLELKYLVTRRQVDAIREWLQPIVSLDRHVPAGAQGYTVNNVYLDTPDLRFYHDVKLKKLRRFKPRVRYYGDRPRDFLWLEIKNKQSPIVWKHRSSAPVGTWPELLFEPPARESSLALQGAPRTFAELVQLYGASPVLHVRYFREPWVSEIDEYGRVTFDSRLRGRLARGSLELAVPEEEMLFFDDPITSRTEESLTVLELKVERQVPRWALELVRRFELTQRGYSKYCYTIDQAREAAAAPRRRSALAGFGGW